eukprot:COSAG06_NODE_6123_length_3097_cov_4.489326_3_plen_33_part_00
MEEAMTWRRHGWLMPHAAESTRDGGLLELGSR